MPRVAGVLLDLAYLSAASATAPLWAGRMAATGKLRTDWRARLGYASPLPAPSKPRLLLHAVSVGEVNAARLLVEQLRQEGVEVVVATTTDTGTARARALFAPHATDRLSGDAAGGTADHASARNGSQEDGQFESVFRFPFDFSANIRRFLDAIQPDAVALVELEVWPNFVAACQERGVPVAVVNGRLSARSFGRYRLVAPLLRRSFATLAGVAAQDEAYAERFRALGVPAERVAVTGTMKWDTAQIADAVEGSDALAAEMGIDRSRPLVVAGSTAGEEHALLRDAVPAGVQLLCAPRKPEWFDAAAAALPGCARRSKRDRGSATDRFLLDTIGELRRAYALADVVVVGRTFVPLGGSDMIEPVGLGKATVVGPHVDNFQESVAALEAGGGVARTDAAALGATLRELIDSPERRQRLADGGRAVIRARQGATARNATLIHELLRRSVERRLSKGQVAVRAGIASAGGRGA